MKYILNKGNYGVIIFLFITPNQSDLFFVQLPNHNKPDKQFLK